MRTTSAQKVKEAKESTIVSNTDKATKELNKTKEQFLVTSYYSIDQILLSGRVLFGDPLTTYCNKIVQELLKNKKDLAKQITVYTLKSSSVNAFSTNQGVIFVNVGLLARLKSEAELAFILSHEIAHFELKHALNGYLEEYEIKKRKGKYSRKTFDEKMDLISKFSQKDEFEADSLGSILFSSSSYNTSAIKSAFDMLLYADFPFGNKPFDKAFFNTENFIIPSIYFKDSISKISVTENYDDKYTTHPNIDRRKSQIQTIFKQNPEYVHTEYSLFVQPESTFETMRELARFEGVNLNILRRSYIDAIYESFLLLEKHPNNTFLWNAIVKSLYGLCKYKDADESHRVIRSSNTVEGESQQLHYLMRMLDKKQLNVLAIKFIEKVNAQHVSVINLNTFKSDLIRELVLVNRLKLEDFKTDSTALNTSTTATNNRNFYKQSFAHELNDEKFKAMFQKYYQELQEIKDFEKLPIAEKLAKEKADALKIKKEGPRLFIKNAILLEPEYIVATTAEVKYSSSDKLKDHLIASIKATALKHGIRLNFISSEDIIKGNTQNYNELANLNTWMQEKYSHGDIEILSLYGDQVTESIEKYDTDIIASIKFYYNESTDKCYYDISFYSIESEKMFYSKSDEINHIVQNEELDGILNDVFEFIKR